MTIQDMHWDFKIKLNKVDSSDFPNFQIPEIDWLLNEAQILFLKQRYGISNQKRLGFEVSQKRIDDLRNLVVKDYSQAAALAIGPPSTVPNAWFVTVPSDYAFLVRAYVTAEIPGGEGEPPKCPAKALTAIQVQHDDLSSVLSDPFYSPSYSWGEVPMVFGTRNTDPPPVYPAVYGNLNEVYAYTDGTFNILTIVLDYLRMPLRVAYPSGVPGGQYDMPDGTVINTDLNSELPLATHEEVVDIAVQLAAGDIDHPGYQVRAMKTSIHE